MSNLSKETLARIEKDAEAYGESHQDTIVNIHKYSTYADNVSAYQAGALHEAERAEPIVEALEGARDYISSLIEPALWNKDISDEQRQLIKMRNTIDERIAKYKEVSNG